MGILVRCVPVGEEGAQELVSDQATTGGGVLSQHALCGLYCTFCPLIGMWEIDAAGPGLDFPILQEPLGGGGYLLRSAI